MKLTNKDLTPAKDQLRDQIWEQVMNHIYNETI